jgi:hypothetical protein
MEERPGDARKTPSFQECRNLSHYLLRLTLLRRAVAGFHGPDFFYVLPLQSPTDEELYTPHAERAAANGTHPARIF